MAIRLISSAVGVVIAVLVLIFHNTIVLEIALGVICVIMLYEMLNAIKCFDNLFLSIPSLIYAFTTPFWITTVYSFLQTFVYILLLFMFTIIKHKDTEYKKLLMTIAVSLLIPNAMGSLVVLHDLGSLAGILLLTEDNSIGLMYLIMGLCGAWLADSAAYFVGTFLGKHKLCPEISPKKTIEGFVGGVVVTGVLFVLINLVFSLIVDTISVNYIVVFILGALLAVVGTIGDLSASILKRQCGIKDYGNIMPGHGGLMDRFDSVLFVAPFLYAFLTLFNIYN